VIADSIEFINGFRAVGDGEVALILWWDNKLLDIRILSVLADG
jgi:hypothetical protein